MKISYIIKRKYKESWIEKQKQLAVKEGLVFVLPKPDYIIPRYEGYNKIIIEGWQTMKEAEENLKVFIQKYGPFDAEFEYYIVELTIKEKEIAIINMK